MPFTTSSADLTPFFGSLVKKTDWNIMSKGVVKSYIQNEWAIGGSTRTPLELHEMSDGPTSGGSTYRGSRR